MTEQTKRAPRIRNVIIVVIVVLVGLVWFAIARSDQDWLWFVPVFKEEASRIHLYRDGEEIMLQPGDAGYEEVNEAINQIIRRVSAKETLELPLESQADYFNQFSAVEAFYGEPVIIHTIHRFPRADKYLIPQTGRHFEPPVVFAGMQSRADYRKEVLVLESRERLDEAVDAVWAVHERE